MIPEISQEFYNFINSIIDRETRIPDGFDVPDFYFIKLFPIIDYNKKNSYRPYIVLKFGDNYRDDIYKSILISPEFVTIEIEE